MQIIVEIRSVYGKETIYPICDAAKTFSKLCGTKTLTREAINHIKELGYEIQVSQPIVSL